MMRGIELTIAGALRGFRLGPRRAFRIHLTTAPVSAAPLDRSGIGIAMLELTGDDLFKSSEQRVAVQH
jgi:hypothetical protein